VYALLVYFSFALFLIIPFFPQEFPDHRLSGNMNRPEHHRTTSMSKGALFRKKKLWAQSTGAGAAKTKGTTISQFKTSLEELIQALVDTNPYFVRCIKSNTRQTPQEFDTEYVRRQLKYLGVVETVRIRKLGYSVRLSFEEFAFRYQKLRPRDSVVMDHRQESVEILNSCKLDQRSYQLGKTKVFLKEGAAIYLEKCVKCLQVWAAHQIITAVKILFLLTCYFSRRSNMLLYVHRVKYRDYKRALREKEEEERRRQEERLRQEEEERLRREEEERSRREEQERLRREEQERLRREEQDRLRKQREEEERLKQQQEMQERKAEEEARRRTQSMNEEDERRRKMVEQTKNIPVPPPLTSAASLPEIPLSTSLLPTNSSVDLDLMDHSVDALASQDSSESAENLQVPSSLLLFKTFPLDDRFTITLHCTITFSQL